MIDTNKMHFGYNFKRICEENGITIKEVHEATEIPLNTLYSITKRKTREPRDQEIKEKVFDYLKTRVPDLTWRDFYPIYVPESDEDLDENDLIGYMGILNSLSDSAPDFLMHLFNGLNDKGQAIILKKLLEMKEMEQYKKED